MTNVYFVRHGETDLNLTHVIQGRIDTHGLNDKGREQAKLLVDFVAAQGLRGDALLSSPLKRAVETAVPLAAQLGLEVQTDARLMEMFFGSCDGIPTAELRAMTFNPALSFKTPDGGTIEVPNGKVLREYHALTDPLYDNLAHPGGETKAEARTRMCEAVFSFLKDQPQTKNLWVVCHGAILRFLTGKFTPVEQHIAGGVKNASVLHFTWDAAKPETLAWQGELHAPEGAIGM